MYTRMWFTFLLALKLQNFNWQKKSNVDFCKEIFIKMTSQNDNDEQ